MRSLLTFFTLASFIGACAILYAFVNQDKNGRSPLTAILSPSGSAPSTKFAPFGQPAPASAQPTISGSLSSFFDFIKSGLSTNPGGFGHHTSRQRGEMRIARGIVVDQSPAGVVMDCSGWIVRSIHGYVYAGDGQGMDPMAANLVDAHEQFQFGRMMTVDHGVVRQSISVFEKSTWNTGSYLYGRLLLKDYPPGSPGRGRGVKVVVVPDGDATWQGNSIPAYTATFTLAD